MTNSMIQAIAAAGVTGELQNVKVGGGLTPGGVLPLRVDMGVAHTAINKITNYKVGDNRETLLVIEECVRQSQYNDQDRDTIVELLAKVVNGDWSKDAKAFSCRQLWIIGTPAIVPALGNALKDPELNDMVRYALQNVESPNVNMALYAALDGTPPSVQIGCINSLVERKAPGAADAIKPLRKSKDKGVEAAAKHALSRLDGKII